MPSKAAERAPFGTREPIKDCLRRDKSLMKCGSRTLAIQVLAPDTAIWRRPRREESVPEQAHPADRGAVRPMARILAATSVVLWAGAQADDAYVSQSLAKNAIPTSTNPRRSAMSWLRHLTGQELAGAANRLAVCEVASRGASSGEARTVGRSRDQRALESLRVAGVL
jgi:hypothetical protein